MNSGEESTNIHLQYLLTKLGEVQFLIRFLLMLH